MKRFTASMILVAVVLAAVGLAPGAFAQPDADTACSDCHGVSSPAASASLKSNNGTTAVYTVTTKAQYVAVYEGTSKVGKDIKVKAGSASVPVSVGTTHTIYAVKRVDEDTAGVISGRIWKAFTVNPPASPAETKAALAISVRQLDKLGKSTEVTGTISPSHEDTTTVTVLFYQANSKWKKILDKKKQPKNVVKRVITLGPGQTEFKAKVKLPAVGRWLVVAQHQCIDHVLSQSSPAVKYAAKTKKK